MSDATPILHMLSPQKHMSPFDVNMAADAGYQVIVPYINVTLEEVTGLVQDAIFSRPPQGCHPLARHDGCGGQGYGAAVPALGVRRPGRLVHDGGGDGRVR